MREEYLAVHHGYVLRGNVRTSRSAGAAFHPIVLSLSFVAFIIERYRDAVSDAGVPRIPRVVLLGSKQSGGRQTLDPAVRDPFAIFRGIVTLRIHAIRQRKEEEKEHRSHSRRKFVWG